MLDQKKKQFSLVVLVDNTPHPKYSNLQAEHGLSIYFELGAANTYLMLEPLMYFMKMHSF